MASLAAILARKSPLFQGLRSASSPLLRADPKSLLRTSAVSQGGLVADHGKLWNFERVIATLQVPAVVIPFTYTTPVTDAIFCTLAVLHTHWEIEGCAVDYIRPSLFNGSNVIPYIAQAAVWVLSAAALGGLFYFNYTDIGFVNAIKMFWRLN
eukprot:TRINITY_DN2466_c0_g1_i1.p1 TRINITY_DN2466_c0_g1~~TRINITY_DN2466_c0_g1_i1.p1  ORF type:complete len:153 (-),score=39.19 TRINITY_DN2466_c0_g1_i1:345-803(-)